MLGSPNLPIAQRVLNEACNRAIIAKRIFEKALRLGADLNAPCTLDGSPVLALYARHGRQAYGAALLFKNGARPEAANHKGRHCAHVAIHALNRDIAFWCLRAHANLFSIPDQAGLLPWDMLFGEFSDGWSEPDERFAFRTECMALMQDSERESFSKRALRSFCMLLNERKYDDIEADVAWMSSLNPLAASREQAMEWIGEDCDELIAEHALAMLSSFFCEHERLQISDASPSAPSLRQKKISI